MARKSQLKGLTAKQKKKIYNQRHYQKKKTGTVRSYTKEHFDADYAFKTNKTLESRKSLDAYIKQFKKTNKKILESMKMNPDFLDPRGYADITAFKKAMNAIFRAAALRMQKQGTHNKFTSRANDMILQQIYDQLPPSGQTEIQIVMGTPNPVFVGFDWNSAGGYFENADYIAYVKGLSNDQYQEDTLIVEPKTTVEQMYQAAE